MCCQKRPFFSDIFFFFFWFFSYFKNVKGCNFFSRKYFQLIFSTFSSVSHEDDVDAKNDIKSFFSIEHDRTFFSTGFFMSKKMQNHWKSWPKKKKFWEKSEKNRNSQNHLKNVKTPFLGHLVSFWKKKKKSQKNY